MSDSGGSESDKAELPPATSNQSPDEYHLQNLIDEFLARRDSGSRMSETEFIGIHPEVREELALELARLRRLEEAEAAANTTGASLDAALDGENESTLPEVPGYKLFAKLGGGGQGHVFQGIQLATTREVAIKIPLKGRWASEAELQRFNQEVRILAALEHPNIVQIFDRGVTADGRPFLVMPFIRGKTLDLWLADYYKKYPEGPPPTHPSELIKLFLLICDAVNAAHLIGVVHRDLKPKNIIVDQKAQPHILDFGLARAWVLSSDHVNPFERPGLQLGTFLWMSPEQFDGQSHRADTRCDVYALGVILYQMLAQRFPFDLAEIATELMRNITEMKPQPPSYWARMMELAGCNGNGAAGRTPSRENPPLNAIIDAIVLKALSKYPDDRYQTAGEFARDLTDYLSGRPVRAAMSGPLPTPGFRVPRIVWGAAAASIALVLAALLVSGGSNVLIPGNADRTKADEAGVVDDEITQRERAVAIHVISQGGTVVVHGIATPISQVEKLPIPGTLFNLQWVNVRPGIKVVEDELVVYSQLPLLHGLTISDSNLADRHLALFKNCRKLQWVIVPDSPYLTDESVEILVEMKNLAYLDVTRTGITPGAMERLRLALPNCNVKY